MKIFKKLSKFTSFAAILALMLQMFVGAMPAFAATAGCVVCLTPDPMYTVITQSPFLVNTAGSQSTINAAVGSAVSGLNPYGITLTNNGSTPSANVRISPVNAGANIQLWAKDSSNNWYDINNTGWMSAAGISLPAGYTATTDVYAISTGPAGYYPITVNLVSVSDSSVVDSTSGTLDVRAPGLVLDNAQIQPSDGTSTSTTPTLWTHAIDSQNEITGCEYKYSTNGDPLGAWLPGTYLADVFTDGTPVVGVGECSSPAISTLPTDTTFSGQLRVTDSAGLSTDSAVMTLNINATAPTVTVLPVITNNNPLPTISGTIDDPTATVWGSVTSNSDPNIFSDFTGVNNADGTWDASVVDALPEGTYTIDVTADNLVNVGYGSNSYIVDTTVPVIANHANVNAVATSLTGAVVSYTVPTATDNVDPSAPAVCSPASGSTFAIGTTDVTCTKTDAAGNSAAPTHFNVVVTAPAPVVLSYTAGTGGSVNGQQSQSLMYGVSGTSVTAVANTGYHFANWSDGVITATRTDSVSTNVTANFVANVYNAIFNVDGLITNVPTAFGSTIVPPASPSKSGFTFDKWSPIPTTMSAGDLTFFATWTPATDIVTPVTTVAPPAITDTTSTNQSSASAADLFVANTPAITDVAVLGSSTTKPSTSTTAADKSSDPKSTDFFASTMLGIYDWVWLLIAAIALAIGGAWWYVVRGRREV